MALTILGYVLLILGGIGLVQSIISVYAEYRIRKDEYERMRWNEQQQFKDQVKVIWRMRIVSVVLLVLGIFMITR